MTKFTLQKPKSNNELVQVSWYEPCSDSDEMLMGKCSKQDYIQETSLKFQKLYVCIYRTAIKHPIHVLIKKKCYVVIRRKFDSYGHSKPQGHGFGNTEWTLFISTIISSLSSTLHASSTCWSCHNLVAPKTALATRGCRRTKAAYQ